MTQATPAVRGLARRLLEQETLASERPGNAFAAQRALDKLRRHLATLVGVAGFQALVSRALALAKPESDWLEAVRVKSDGSLDGFVEAARERAADEVAKGGAALLAQLLGLLVAFIGEGLTLRLVREAWSDATLGEVRTDVKESQG